MFTAIMPAVTLGVVSAFAVGQYRKMKNKKNTEANAGVHAAEHLQQKDIDEERAKRDSGSSPRGTPPVQQTGEQPSLDSNAPLKAENRKTHPAYN